MFSVGVRRCSTWTAGCQGIPWACGNPHRITSGTPRRSSSGNPRYLSVMLLSESNERRQEQNRIADAPSQRPHLYPYQSRVALVCSPTMSSISMQAQPRKTALRATETGAVAVTPTGLKRETILLPRNCHDTDWLDASRPSCQVFIRKYGRALVAHTDQASTTYFTMDASLHAELARITTELHTMFVKATEHVCKTPELWPAFGYPPQYWPRAIASFYQADKILTGRFDFSVTPAHGIKVLEYNADSASCLFECGYSQEAWAKAAGIQEGVSAGIGTERRLVHAWQSLNLPPGTLIHFLHDTEDEEQYHALYMMELATRAGYRTKVYHDVANFRFGEHGNILDSEQKTVKYVWKTWSYNTLLSLWRRGGGGGGGGGDLGGSGGETSKLRTSGEHVRLVDVCLNENIIVFEPWWAAIPSNKAILPVLNDLFPGHPNLLLTSWTLTEKLKASGYVTKPILGRCGENVAVHAPQDVGTGTDSLAPGQPTERTGGRFAMNTCVYQELSTLPRVGGDYVQVNTWAVAGVYGGTVLRVDKSAIVNNESESVALRIVDDGSSAALPTLPDAWTLAQAAINNNSQVHQRNHVYGKGELIRENNLVCQHNHGEDDEGQGETTVVDDHGEVPMSTAAPAATTTTTTTTTAAAATAAAGKTPTRTELLPFGTVLGFAPGGIAAYSCDYNTADRSVYSSRVSYRHQAQGLYYGFKYQCVEFSRRWLIHVMGLTYGDVGMAYEIFHLRDAIRVHDDCPVPWTNVENGQPERPQVGSLLIWNEGGEFRITGHVAVVVAVTDTYVRVAEQNVHDISWNGRDYSRQLSVRVDKASNGYFIEEVDGSIKGWKNLPCDFVKEPIPLAAAAT